VVWAGGRAGAALAVRGSALGVGGRIGVGGAVPASRAGRAFSAAIELRRVRVERGSSFAGVAPRGRVRAGAAGAAGLAVGAEKKVVAASGEAHVLLLKQD
jgi:hypothetical protein